MDVDPNQRSFSKLTLLYRTTITPDGARPRSLMVASSMSPVNSLRGYVLLKTTPPTATPTSYSTHTRMYMHTVH